MYLYNFLSGRPVDADQKYGVIYGWRTEEYRVSGVVIINCTEDLVPGDDVLGTNHAQVEDTTADRQPTYNHRRLLRLLQHLYLR